METLAAYIMTAILSPLVCFAVYLYIKTEHKLKKLMRRNEMVEAIKSDYTTQAAITGLIIEKMANDYLFQQAITTLVITQLEKDWKLEKAVLSIAKKAS